MNWHSGGQMDVDDLFAKLKPVLGERIEKLWWEYRQSRPAPSLVSLPSLGNAYTTMAFNLKHGADVRAIGEAMLLNDEQREYVGRLETGQAIVRLQGRWHQPFLVQLPLVAVAKGSVADEALEARFGSQLPVVLRTLQLAFPGQVLR